MPIEYQSQVWVGCDFCPAHYAEQAVPMKDVAVKLRKQGWKIGKYVRCPDCAAAIRNNKVSGSGPVGGAV